MVLLSLVPDIILIQPLSCFPFFSNFGIAQLKENLLCNSGVCEPLHFPAFSSAFQIRKALRGKAFLRGKDGAHFGNSEQEIENLPLPWWASACILLEGVVASLVCIYIAIFNYIFQDSLTTLGTENLVAFAHAT